MKKRDLLIALASAAALTVPLSACAKHEHKIYEVAEQRSTCVSAGVAAHYACDCGKLFADADGAETTTADALALPLAEHAYVVRGDADGHADVCVVCEARGEKAGHTPKAVGATTATPVKDGHEAGVVCGDCGYVIEGLAKRPRTSPFLQGVYGGLNYCVYEPSGIKSGSDKAPLVVFLHGAGERGGDNMSQLKNAIGEVVFKDSDSLFMDAVVIAPQCPDGMQWVDTPWANGNYSLAEVEESDVMQKTVRLVEYYSRLRYVDENRVYVVGVSMGAFGAWDMLARHTDMFAAGVSVCGGGPSDAAETLAGVPIYAFHGTEDKTVPFGATEEMIEALTAVGGENAVFVPFEGESHAIWDKAIVYGGDDEHPPLDEWLFGKSRTVSGL